MSHLAQIQAELARLAEASPRAALGVGPDANADDVNEAFDAACEKYRPSRFADVSPGVAQLANQIVIRLTQARNALLHEVGDEGTLPGFGGQAPGQKGPSDSGRWARPQTLPSTGRMKRRSTVPQVQGEQAPAVADKTRQSGSSPIVREESAANVTFRPPTEDPVDD